MKKVFTDFYLFLMDNTFKLLNRDFCPLEEVIFLSYQNQSKWKKSAIIGYFLEFFFIE